MYDYLIIGHGLAGAILSRNLIKQGQTVMVIDQPQMNNSSAVAAGIYNPITGRKMIKTWLADDIFPTIEHEYEKLENLLDAKFIHKIGIYRPFLNIEEQNDWDGKRSDPKFKPYISSISNKPIPEFNLTNPYGGLHLNMSGYVDVVALIESNRNHLISENAYTETEFKESSLVLTKGNLSYGQIKFKKLIFCNGYKAFETSLFGWLPFRPVKGEILKILLNKNASKIYNRGIFILPINKKVAKVGSTYKNTFEDVGPTKEGKVELLTKLNQLMQEEHEVTDTMAGVRPATKDRRPFIGKHPEYEHLYVFNGFGSKGVSLIPYFSSKFIDSLTGNSSIDDSVNIERYYSYYDDTSSS